MSLPLSPHVLAAAYEYLRATPPYRRWNLPHADQVEFAITAHQDRFADHTTYCYTKDHIIRVSSRFTGHTSSLMCVLGHEMIHARQAVTRTSAPNAGHNAEFHKLAKLACRYHGWDERSFA